MYRLIKLRGTNFNNIHSVTYNFNLQNDHLNLTERACRLCKQIHLYKSKSLIRFQSTFTNPSLETNKVRKKRPKILKSYAELLVVTNSSSTQMKARVKKLDANDIGMLAVSDLNLNELYKLKDLMKSNNKIINEHTYNNLTDVNNLPTLGSGVINLDEVLPSLKTVISNSISENKPESKTHGNVDLEKDIKIIHELDRLKPSATFQPEILEEELIEPEVEETIETDIKTPIEITKKKSRYDLKAREEIISNTLAAYIEVCCSLRAPQRGLNAFNFMRYRLKSEDKIKLKNMNIYNALLKGFAMKGDFVKMNEVIRISRDEGVKFNVQSYSAIFECLGRVNYQNNHLKEIKYFTNEAIGEGYSFDRILNEGTFLFDQREKVIESMKAYNPKYEPKYFEPSVHYCNQLVNHLNHEDQLKGLKDMKESKDSLFKRKQLKELIKKQMSIEENGIITINSIETKIKPNEEILRYREAWKNHVKMWEEAAYEAFNRDLAALSAKRNSVNMDIYMRCIPLKDYITIITDEAQKLAQGSETYSPTVNMLYRDLGQKVYLRYKVLKKQKSGVIDKISSIHNKYCENYADSHVKLGILPTVVDNLNSRQKWQWIEHMFKGEGATIGMDHQEWVPPALINIGKFLYNIIMHDLKIDVNVMRNNTKHKNHLPAFYTIFRNQGRLVKEEVKPHPVLSKLYRASVPQTLNFPAYEVPMICPPVPWTSVNNGGYLIAPCEVVRLPSSATAQKEILRDTKVNNLYPSLDAINQLASVPWKVNQQLLKVALEVFNTGGSAKLDIPEPPSSLEPPPSMTADMDKTQRYMIFRKRLQYRRQKGEMYSLWCDCLYRLSLANHFKDEVFWLPHNMDFRGRVYPVPPHLNHLGSDLAKSMLIFAEARPLGPNGLDWLKLHLINLTGTMKRDRVEDRLKHANNIMDKILDSADNPLTGIRWWAESDEPWQTLACCMEIARAVRSPNPEEYLSHFPVHQDGSCNGLQHYAALGRDSAGAFSVNLCPSSVPQDVYSAVATLVEEKRKADAAASSEIAKILDGFVKRKVIKQTVMTTVYGVTRYGARLQIAKQLKDIDDFPKESVWAGSSYLTQSTFESLRTMFTSTKEIQDWFTECARLISTVCGKNVEWVTPLGLPIVQPYFRYKKFNVKSLCESFQMDKFEKPNVMKQKNAFPPNFIHSLDSSHMMLTSLHCERAGITFVSVHDCYWTHPSTVHIMNKICREQFVALHSQPILEDLSLFFTEKYSYDASEINDDGSVTELTKKKLNRLLRKLPRTGKFNIKEVLDSIYFFS